jgi:8-oxo-dGTP pyrophosphatase MutT (NUDIX family)
MNTHLDKIKLPQNLTELMAIDTENIDISKWSGAVNFLFAQDHLFLIKRSETMLSHKGQIAFLGGHKKDNEVDPIKTAKREFEEETGLSSEILNIIGLSHPTRTSGRSIIIPVVSFIDTAPEVFLNQVTSNGEWTDAMVVPVSYLKNKEYWVSGNAYYDNKALSKVLFFALEATDLVTKRPRDNRDYILWGATAKMIWKFFKNYY